MSRDLNFFERTVFTGLLALLGVIAFGAVFLGWPAAPGALVLLAQTLVATHFALRGGSGHFPVSLPWYAWPTLSGTWAGLTYAALYDPALGLVYGGLLALILSTAHPRALVRAARP